MKRWANFLSVVIVAVLAVSAGTAGAVEIRKEDGTQPWTTFDGDWRITPALPDKTSMYGVLVIQKSWGAYTGDFDYIKITGKFPHARFLGYSLADFNGNNTDQGIYDQQMVADDGSVNPFDVTQSRNAENRDYTVYVVKAGVQVPGGNAGKNVLTLSASLDIPSMGLRGIVWVLERVSWNIGAVKHSVKPV